MERRAVAEACTNIALVKYWGKRDGQLNLPAVGSFSLTLDGLSTRTEVRFDSKLESDALTLNNLEEAGPARTRVSAFLDLIRERAQVTERARVVSANNFPTAAGLASSASAFAALTLAASRAAGLTLSARELSILARRGSGSAARSIGGGLVELHRGQREDGADCFAEVRLDRAETLAWGLRMVVAVTTRKAKETLSTEGMKHTAKTSPYFSAWVETSEPDLNDARRAVQARDLPRLGEVTERSALTMHASALAARPAVIYFNGVTVDGYHVVQELRRAGVPAWFTCDAGPHIKALTDAPHAERVAARLREIPGVLETRVCAPGEGARVIE